MLIDRKQSSHKWNWHAMNKDSFFFFRHLFMIADNHLNILQYFYFLKFIYAFSPCEGETSGKNI